MEIEGTWQRGHMRKTWWDCDKRGMKSFVLSYEDAQDRDHWRLKIKGKQLCLSLSVSLSLELSGWE